MTPQPSSTSENRPTAGTFVPASARMLARTNYASKQTRFGEPMIEHVERVAAAVPPQAQTTALLHEILELSPGSRARLRLLALSPVELAALSLLTHRPGEPYERYLKRIAQAPGDTGQLARTVKLADLNGLLSHASIPASAPRYAWARDQLLLTRRDQHDLYVQPAMQSLQRGGTHDHRTCSADCGRVLPSRVPREDHRRA